MYKTEKTFNVIQGKVPDFSKCEVEKNTIWEYVYEEKEQILEVPCKGKYKLEVWGAQGGSSDSTNSIGGYGGYANGEITIDKQKKLYIYVGGAGIKTNLGPISAVNGGFNGGGKILGHTDSHTIATTGGGATHIALVPGLLSTLEEQKEQILIVAGGGGGSATNIASGPGWTPTYAHSGSGGGFQGVDSQNFHADYGNTDSLGYGGTQDKGGTNYHTNGSTTSWYGSFGLGGPSTVSGGGGGFYGGGSGGYPTGGGSGYIGNPLLTNKIMWCYNCIESEEDTTKTKTTTNVSEEATSEYAKIGNGFAKITYLGK